MNAIKGQRVTLRKRALRPTGTARLYLEWLESRDLPAAPTSASALAPIVNPPGNGPTVVAERPNSQANPQNLGVFTSAELDGGITLVGSFESETADYYAFQVTATFPITITLQPFVPTQGLPSGAWLTLTDVTANQDEPLLTLGLVPTPGSQVNSGGQITVVAVPAPGATYVLAISSWAADTLYTIGFTTAGAQPEQPSPLSLAAAASSRLQLLNDGTGPTPSVGPSFTGSPSPTSTTANTTVPVAFSASSGATPVIAANYSLAGNTTNTIAPAGNSSIPASIYVALSAGPVGGFTGNSNGNLSVTTDIYDRIYGQGPALALSERFLGLAILSQISMSAPVETAPSARPTARVSPVSTTGVLKADTALDYEEEAFFDGEQVQADTQEIPATVALGLNAGAEPATEMGIAFTQRTGTSGTSPRLDAAVAVSVLFAALGDRRQRYAEVDTVTG
jgi:hypothetical protein